MSNRDERHPADLVTILEDAAGALLGTEDDLQDDELLAEGLEKAAEIFDAMRKLAGLVSTAAAKHTGAMARVRTEGHDEYSKRLFDRNAVGRLHNAARLAREILDGGGCAMCADRYDNGLKPKDGAGTCAECGRGLGRLEDSRKTRVVQRRRQDR